MSEVYVSIESQPINTHDAIPIGLDVGRDGALVSFQGLVRATHEGKAVSHLIYECYRPLAMKEMHKILCEANERFNLSQSFIIHREGHLGVGEMAVWTAVLSPHRKEAFLACAWVMDELKVRVPIWKQEFFEDGSYSWPGLEKKIEAKNHLHQ